MKIKVYRSRISKKRCEKFAFPRYIRSKDDRTGDVESPQTVTKLKLERVPAVYTEDAAVGFYAIKNFKEIVSRMQSDRDTFGRCLNKLVGTFSDIVLSEDGVVGKFSGVGALFAFKAGSKPKESVQKALITALRMRYVLNKLNREWDFYFKDAWQVGFGVDFGNAAFQEHHEKREGYVVITGKPGKIARGIGQSASSSQILVTESLYIQFTFIEKAFELKAQRHVPVKGEDFLSKIREVVGMVGPQAKDIYTEYV